jgi:hypothetical protein
MKRLLSAFLIVTVAACATTASATSSTRRRSARYARLNAGFTPPQQAHIDRKALCLSFLGSGD